MTWISSGGCPRRRTTSQRLSRNATRTKRNASPICRGTWLPERSRLTPTRLMLTNGRPIWRYVALVASGVVGVGVVVVGVCNRSQMRTSKHKCLIFGLSIGLDPAYKCTKGIFDRSKFNVTHDISPTISGWLLVSLLVELCSI